MGNRCEVPALAFRSLLTVMTVEAARRQHRGQGRSPVQESLVAILPRFREYCEGFLQIDEISLPQRVNQSGSQSNSILSFPTTRRERAHPPTDAIQAVPTDRAAMNPTNRERLVRVIEEAIVSEYARAQEEAAASASVKPERKPSKLAALLPTSFFRPLAPAAATPPQLAPSARTVMTLRPRPGLLLDGTLTIAAAATKMQESNSSAALIVDASGVLEGIITDSDVTRKVLAKRLDPAKVCVADAMTRSPKSVTDEDNASQALSIMVEGKFRHLPVLGSGQAAGKLCGVLDVVKCLFDAISTIESSHLPGGQVTLELLLAAVAAGHLDAASSSASPTSSGSPTSSAMVHVSHEDAAAAVSGKDAASEAAGADEPHHTTSRWEAVTARFSLFRSSSKSGNGSSDSGGSSSTSSSAASSPAADVRPTILPSASVQKAAEQMAARKGAVLVSEATQRRVGRDYFGLGLSSSSSSSSASAVGVSSCAGVLTPKDVLYRVLARGLDPSHTQVCQVMTPSPDCISSSATILDALHQLQGAGYRQLPVLDATTGAPVGVVDVLTLIQGAMLLGQPSSNSPAAKADPSTFSTFADTVAAPAAGATAATAASAASAPATAATKGLMASRPSEVDVADGFELTGRDDEATGPGSPFVCVDDPSSASSRASDELDVPGTSSSFTKKQQHLLPPALGNALPSGLEKAKGESDDGQVRGGLASHHVAGPARSKMLWLVGVAGLTAALIAVAAARRRR